MMIARQPARAMTAGPHTNGRRGISLIELMVVMTGVAVILGLCAVTIQAMLRVNSDAQSRLNASATFARLASQFREDVHASNDVQLSPATKAGDAKPAPTLRLTQGPRIVITYEVSPGRVARVESASGKMSRRESYRIGNGNLTAFERRDEGARHFVALVMSRDAGKGPIEPPRPLEVLALQGKDRTGIPQPKGGQKR
jgi:type II secretory pathway pseudopilin PulG